MSNSRARPPNRSKADPRPPLPVPTQEVHFLAEDEHLDIVPNFSLQGLHLLGGQYDDLPEMAFYMVGDINEVMSKADELAKQVA